MGDIQSTQQHNSSVVGINAISDQPWDPTKSYMIDFQNRGKGESYGKPPEGSLTEARAILARARINKELVNLIRIIRMIGEPDVAGSVCVSFGKLFRYYEPISDKIVGLLLRARRWRLVDFPGEMLYQRRDENIIIRLLVTEEHVPPQITPINAEE